MGGLNARQLEGAMERLELCLRLGRIRIELLRKLGPEAIEANSSLLGKALGDASGSVVESN
jgi:hypothetical protein